MKYGFTLAELLISLAILGVIATFTIPKVLQSQQDGRYNAIAKEAIGMISGAYQQYQREKTVIGSPAAPRTCAQDLTPYMNYVAVQQTDIDHFQGQGVRTCNAFGHVCLKLHNGATLWMDQITPSSTVSCFDGTTTSHSMAFMLDPDGRVTDGTTNGPGKSLYIFLYYTGHIRTYASALNNTMEGNYQTWSTPANDPPWFSWN